MRVALLILMSLGLFVTSMVVHHGQSTAKAIPSGDVLWPESPKLNGALTILAGKPVQVRCYRDVGAWDVLVRQAGFPGGDVVDGLTYPGRSDAEISPQRCRAVYYALRVGAAKANIVPLAWALNVLAHETMHIAGHYNEAEAEACALRRVANLANLLYGVKYRTRLMHDLVLLAVDFSRRYKPPTYQGGRCV